MLILILPELQKTIIKVDDIDQADQHKENDDNHSGEDNFKYNNVNKSA